jgi:redox-regulated HSP33 family molecular chaperone
MESHREALLSRWNNFLEMLGSPGEWALSPNSEKATEEMTSLIFASPKGMKIFSKTPVYFCSCTEEKVTSLMKILSQEDLDALDETFEVACKYCGKIYLVDKSKSGLA